LEAHRLRHLINRAIKLVEESEEKDHIYQMAGDMIVSVPDRLDKIDIALDRTSLALARMGEEFLDARLSISDKQLVDDAISAAFGSPKHKESAEERVASRYMIPKSPSQVLVDLIRLRERLYDNDSGTLRNLAGYLAKALQDHATDAVSLRVALTKLVKDWSWHLGSSPLPVETSVLAELKKAIARLKTVKQAMQVTLGPDGLVKTWQTPFPETTECCKCGGEARFAFTAHEGSDEMEYVRDMYSNDPNGDGLWPHDACAVAVYFCKDCLESTALYNQA